MRLVTNPATNLPPEQLEANGIVMMPQQIVVDEVHHDTRDDVTLQTIDNWIRSAKAHPYVLGTSAAEFVSRLSKLGRDDADLLVVTTSRKLIQSYDACHTARRTLQKHPKWKHLNVHIVDSRTTDIGTGMVIAYAAAARDAGLEPGDVVRVTEEFAAALRVAFVVQEMDNLVKGGRASFLKAWAAKFLGVRPLIEFVDGQLEPASTFKAKHDPMEVLRDWALAGRGLSAGSPVWLACSHGGVPNDARRLADTLAETFDVRRQFTVPLAPSIYLHTGRGALAVGVVPLDGLSWVPNGPAGTGR